jgi:O-antigen/teichoic acid export membrane protein
MNIKKLPIIYRRIGNYIAIKFGLDPKFLLKNSFWINIEWLISRAVKILFNIFIVRQISIEMYGNYNYVLSLLGLLALFSLSGFHSVILREVARRNLRVFKKWVDLGVKFSLIGSLIFIVIASLKYFSDSYLSYALFLCALLFPISYKYIKWDVILFGLMRFKQRAFFNFVKNVATYLPLAIFIYFFKENILLIILAYLLLNLVTDYFLFKRSIKGIDFKGYSDGWIKSGMNISISSALGVIYSYMDKIILFHLIGSEPLAVYAVATYISENLRVVTTNNIRMYFPKIWSKGNKRVIKKFKKVKLLLVLYPLIIFATTYMLAPFIINLFYGEKYRASIKYAQIYALILPLHFFYLLLFSWYIKVKKEYHILLSSIFSAIMTLTSYLILVPMYGIMGAVVGSIIYYLSKLLYFGVLNIAVAAKHYKNRHKP